MNYESFCKILIECGFTLKACAVLWKELPRKGFNPRVMTPQMLRLTAVDFKQNRFALGIPSDWFEPITQPGICKTCGHKDHGYERCNSRTLTGRCGCKLKEFDPNAPKKETVN